ncbi:MAG: hypothetical protein NTW87_22100 [Planctomycetota bacterium]|nr:hypothetical protein [Planctomycetota bacterium]
MPENSGATKKDPVPATIIARTKVREYQRRAFLGTAAAVMLTALGTVRAADEGKEAKGEQDVPKAALREHEEARKLTGASHVVFTTWFPTAQAMHAAVTSKGQRELLKAGTPFPAAPLDGPSLELLLKLLPKLPEGKPAQKLGDALVVSWREGEAWKTRQYNRAALPDEVGAILGLLGVPQDRP